MQSQTTPSNRTSEPDKVGAQTEQFATCRQKPKGTRFPISIHRRSTLRKADCDPRYQQACGLGYCKLTYNVRLSATLVT